MPLNYNRVTIAGNLTRDPEIRFFNNERAVANFSMAVNRRWKSKEGEQMEEVTFIDVEAWGRTAELVGQYLTKGRGAFIEGRLKLDTWDDKDGQKRSKLKVVADSVQFLDGQKRENAGDVSAPANVRQETIGRDGLRVNPAPIGGGAGGPNDDEPPFAPLEFP